MYKIDAGGLAFSCPDIKIHTGSSTWATRLSQLSKQTGMVRIITYSLPDIDYVKTQLGRRPTNILLIAHSKFRVRALEIALTFPGISIRLCDNVHSKVLLIEPGTVYITSANFGSSKWHETGIGLHSGLAHDWYVEKVFKPLWDTLA